MMLQASSRQAPSSGSHHHHTGSSRHHHFQQHQQHQQPRLHSLHSMPPQPQHRYPAPAAAAKSATSASVDDPDAHSGRLASALLFMSVLVLMADASRIILYSWYTDGSYLKYLYGSEEEIRWPKCPGGGNGHQSAMADQPVTTPGPASAVITAVSRRQQQHQQQQQSQPEPDQQERQLDQFKESLTGLLLIAGQLLGSTLLNPTLRPAQPAVLKPLVRVLFHASTVACLFFLAVAIFPAALRSRRGGVCLLSCSLLFSLATMLIAGAAVAASMLNLYFFSACELQQPDCGRLYGFVPQCGGLRRGFLAAECFSLVVLAASVCILLRLKVQFCRALCTCECCRGDSYDYGGDCAGDEFDLPAARSGRRPGGGGYPYDDEEYLA